MRKQLYLNLLLLLIVVVLGGAIYLSDDRPDELARLNSGDSSTISHIVIRHNDNETVITKDAGDWSIIAPINIAANAFRIETLLRLYNAPVHQHYRRGEISLDDSGLADANTSIRFDDVDIAFGIVNPATGLRYILSGDDIYTIEDVYYPLISSHVSTLVSLDLLPKGSEIEELILLNQTISKDTAGRWQSDITIAPDTVADILQQWRGGQAFAVHAYLQRQQLGEVSIVIRGQEPIRYIITDTDPWLILARPEIGLEYHLELDDYDRLISPQ